MKFNFTPSLSKFFARFPNQLRLWWLNQLFAFLFTFGLMAPVVEARAKNQAGEIVVIGENQYVDRSGRSPQKRYNPLLVETTQGLFEGKIVGGVRTWQGIRYAQPPIGARRWKAPLPPRPHDGVYQAFEPGEMSLQRFLLTNKIIGSEDCLFLNVVAPKDMQPGEKLPVFVWIHGGAYILGASHQPVGPINLYNGSEMVKQGRVVFVSLNYRLGIMGFLAHRELAAENKKGANGNYGMMDMIAALKWVQKEIAGFGGDANNVTIAGESAGGHAVAALKASPEARGLFQNAIIQSAPFMELSQERAFAIGDRVEQELAQEKGVDHMTPAQLRSVDGAKLVLQFPFEMVPPGGGATPIAYGPVVDGNFLKYPILETMRRGLHSRGPTIVGTTGEEMRVLSPVFLSELPMFLKQPEYYKFVEQMYGVDMARQAMELYNRDTHGSNKKALNALLNDAAFHSPAQEMAASLEHYDPGSTYRYVWNHELVVLKSGHGTEILSLFPNLFTYLSNHNPLKFWQTPKKLWQQYKLSKQVIRQWTGFTHTGTPNVSSEDIHWPTANYGIMNYNGRDLQVVEDYRGEQSEFWREATRNNAVRIPNHCALLFVH